MLENCVVGKEGRNKGQSVIDLCEGHRTRRAGAILLLYESKYLIEVNNQVASSYISSDSIFSPSHVGMAMPSREFGEKYIISVAFPSIKNALSIF